MVEPSTTRKPSRFWLYLPFILLLILIAAWTAYWFIAKGQLDKGIDQWIADERARGAELEFSSKSLGGFPYRFELVVDDPVYQPVGEPRWEGEQLRLVMQPWNWQHVIAYSPGRNLVTEPGGLRQTVTLDKTSAVSFSWNSEHIERIGLQMGNASALIDGEAYAATGFSLNLKPRDGAEDDLMVALQWDRLTINAAPEGAEFLGDTIGPSRLIGEVRGFFPAWARSGGRPDRFHRALMQENGAIEIAQGLLNWGPLDLGVKGDLTFDDGRANGELGVRIEEADALRDALEASGRLGQQENAMLTMLEASSADGGFLTFTVQDNEVKMGLIPLGTLPEPGY
jgi:hypothetical protein